MIQRNGKIIYVLGLEELILLKYPYNSKQSTDLMQALSKYMTGKEIKIKGVYVYMYSSFILLYWRN